MAGHGRRSTRYPPWPPAGISFPLSSTTAASTPGNGLVAEPGFSVVTPGSGVIRIIPVSVCHHVSTTGTWPPPTYSRYHTHASGLMGSPTVPSSRIEDRSCLPAYSGPHFMWVRMAVGAVYRMVTPYRSAMSHHRSFSGYTGVPSYITPVVALARGPYTM